MKTGVKKLALYTKAHEDLRENINKPNDEVYKKTLSNLLMACVYQKVAKSNTDWLDYLSDLRFTYDVTVLFDSIKLGEIKTTRILNVEVFVGGLYSDLTSGLIRQINEVIN